MDQGQGRDELHYTPDICKGAILFMDTPATESEHTGWVDTAKAYDGLPEDLKSRIEGLEVLMYVHNAKPDGMRFVQKERPFRRPTAEESLGENLPMPDFPPVVHPLVVVHPESPMALKGLTRRGPTFREVLLMHAVARLVLNPHIRNIRTSWVKLGKAGIAACLAAGANDLGGTLMNESISRAADTQHGQELPPAEMEELIASIGRTPRQRTTTYSDVTEEIRRRGQAAPQLSPVILTPPVQRRAASSITPIKQLEKI